MPVVLTEVDEYTADVVAPVAGDNRTAASVVAGLQPLANRTKFFSRLINGGTFNNTAPVVFNGALTVKGNMLIGDGPADSHTVQGTFNNLGVLQASGGFVIPGSLSIGALIEAPIVLSGAGRVRKRVVAVGDTDVTLSPLVADVYYAGPTTLTSNGRVWQIDDSGASDFDEMLLINQDVTNQLEVRKPGGAAIANLTGDPASALRSWCKVMRIGGVWVAMKLVNT